MGQPVGPLRQWSSASFSLSHSRSLKAGSRTRCSGWACLRARVFTLANTAGFLGALARGGMMFLLIMLLQGIWLPLHGYSYESTPFWAGVFMLPLTAGFVIMGPLSGWLSDKYGSRWFATSGMLLVALSFLMLAMLPYNFDYPVFAIALLIMGLGNGMFGAPNIAAIMNSVPPEDTGCRIGHAVDAAEQRDGHLHGPVFYHRDRQPDAPVSPGTRDIARQMPGPRT